MTDGPAGNESVESVELVELISALVAIDSVNPSLVPGAAGEGRIAGFVADWARTAGLTVTAADTDSDTDGRRRSLLVGGRGEAGGGRTLLLCGHLDTVGAGAMLDPFVPRMVGDRLHGRGAYDMKAGLAAALLACRNSARLDLPGRVVVAAVADEEHASSGIEAVLPHIQADAAIVTEPTELEIVTAHKGFVWSRIEVTGRAAHGSRPHLGIDAILATGPILTRLRDLDRELAGRAHPLLGPGSLHASLITGGREESTIPDRCVLTVERRTLPGQTRADVEADLERLLAGCRADDPTLAVTSRTTLARDPMEVDPGQPVVAALAAAVAAQLGRPATVAGASFWADSALIQAAGIPTVLFGPSGDGAHADIEWVSLPDADACLRVLTAVAAGFCTEPSVPR
jgi:acetylornithine deacetylase